MTTDALAASEALSARGAHAPRVSVADIESNIIARHTFVLADALRGMGMPVPPGAELLTVCFLITKNGYSVIGKSAPASPENFDAEKGATFAYEDAVKQLWPVMGYALKERLGFSEAIQSAIRLELAGLPAGRYDVNPTSVPALTVPPDGFTMARSADYPLSDGLVDPIDVSMAWDEVRAQVAEADPPFPGALLGYTVERVTGGGEVVEGENGPETTTGTEAARLTVYA